MNNPEINQTKVVSNGAIVDGITGKIIKPAPISPLADPVIRQKALETRRRNKAMAQAGALRGIIAASNEVAPDIAARITAKRGGDAITRPDDAVEAITETLVTEIVLSNDANEAARGKTWEIVCKQADITAVADRTGQDQPQTVVNVLLAGDAGDRALDIVREFAINKGNHA